MVARVLCFQPAKLSKAFDFNKESMRARQVIQGLIHRIGQGVRSEDYVYLCVYFCASKAAHLKSTTHFCCLLDHVQKQWWFNTDL